MLANLKKATLCGMTAISLFAACGSEVTKRTVGTQASSDAESKTAATPSTTPTPSTSPTPSPTTDGGTGHSTPPTSLPASKLGWDGASIIGTDTMTILPTE